MANKDERRQQDELRQILLEDSHTHQASGRPRARGVTQRGQAPARQQTRPAAQSGAARQSQPSQRRVRQMEQPVYSAPARTRAKQPKAKSNAGTWLLLVVILLLLAIAGFLVYLLLNGGISSLPFIGGGKDDHALPATGALLMETPDAGEGYVAQTIFVGDSNFERLREYGIVDGSTVAAKVGLGVSGISNDPFIEVTGQSSALTIAQTMKAVQPTRMLVMMGTNDVPNMSAEDFAAAYATQLKELRSVAPGAEIVVAAIPPVANWRDGEALNAATVRQFNEQLLNMCEVEGYPFLNIYEALADESGYLPEGSTDDGYHLTRPALDTLITYYRTHAYNP